MIAWQKYCLPWMSRRRHWPTYRCGLEVNVQPPGYPPGKGRQRPLQFAEDEQHICYKCGIIGHIGRQCQSGQMWEMDSNQVAVSETLVTQMYLGAETL